MRMKKKFKSKIEYAIALPVAVFLLVTETMMVVKGIWPLVILIALVTASILYLYVSTIYEFTEEKLMIRSGIFYSKEIYIRSIKTIRETTNYLASPALSKDRLEIFFNRYERVLISPDGKKDFISRIVQLNPKIKVSSER